MSTIALLIDDREARWACDARRLAAILHDFFRLGLALPFTTCATERESHSLYRLLHARAASAADRVDLPPSIDGGSLYWSEQAQVWIADGLLNEILIYKVQRVCAFCSHANELHATHLYSGWSGCRCSGCTCGLPPYPTGARVRVAREGDYELYTAP